MCSGEDVIVATINGQRRNVGRCQTYVGKRPTVAVVSGAIHARSASCCSGKDSSDRNDRERPNVAAVQTVVYRRPAVAIVCRSDRTNREPALTSESPKGQLKDLAAGLADYRRQHARLLQYARTTKDDLRNGFVARQGCDAYQWALLISTHEQRHILQIRGIKTDPKFPRDTHRYYGEVMEEPDRPAALVLVRHAEARNVARKGNRFFLDDESRKAVQGVPDQSVPITDEGRRQAQMTGLAIRSEFGTFDYVYHSGYRRTQETAEHILAVYTPEERDAIRVRHHLFLRERDAGWMYDMTTAEAEAAFPWLQGYWDTFGRFFARPPGGEEPGRSGGARGPVSGHAIQYWPGQRILVVGHGGTLRVFRYLLERWSHDEFLERWESEPVDNCAVTAYAHDRASGRLTLRSLNVMHWRRT